MAAPDDPFIQEILGQPAALRRAAEAVLGQRDVLGRIPVRPRRIVFTGMGSSLHACAVPVTLLAAAGVPAEAVDASELLHFRRETLGPDDLLVAVSQSGRSAEVVKLVEDTRPGGDRPTVVSVTNGLENPVAERSEEALDTAAGPEIAPSTMSFAGSLVMLDALARRLSGATADAAASAAEEHARAAASEAERLLADPAPEADRLRTWLGERSRLVFLGRGAALAAAEMSALTIQEAARRPAQAFVTAGFRHGPLEMSGPDLAAVFLLGDRRTRTLDLRLADDVSATGAVVLLVGSEGGGAGASLVEVGDLPDPSFAAVATIPAQLLAWRLARDAGIEPGTFSVATKTTTTE